MSDTAAKKTLPEWQQALDCQDEASRSPTTAFLHFSDKLGRLARAIRDQRGLYAETGKTQDTSLNVAFGQAMQAFIRLANRTETDLDAAFREKDAYNAGRQWKNKT